MGNTMGYDPATLVAGYQAGLQGREARSREELLNLQRPLLEAQGAIAQEDLKEGRGSRLARRQADEAQAREAAVLAGETLSPDAAAARKKERELKVSGLAAKVRADEAGATRAEFLATPEMLDAERRQIQAQIDSLEKGSGLVAKQTAAQELANKRAEATLQDETDLVRLNKEERENAVRKSRELLKLGTKEEEARIALLQENLKLTTAQIEQIRLDNGERENIFAPIFWRGLITKMIEQDMADEAATRQARVELDFFLQRSRVDFINTLVTGALTGQIDATADPDTIKELAIKVTGAYGDLARAGMTTAKRLVNRGDSEGFAALGARMTAAREAINEIVKETGGKMSPGQMALALDTLRQHLRPIQELGGGDKEEAPPPPAPPDSGLGVKTAPKPPTNLGGWRSAATSAGVPSQDLENALAYAGLSGAKTVTEVQGGITDLLYALNGFDKRKPKFSAYQGVPMELPAVTAVQSLIPRTIPGYRTSQELQGMRNDASTLLLAVSQDPERYEGYARSAVERGVIPATSDFRSKEVIARVLGAQLLKGNLTQFLGK